MKNMIIIRHQLVKKKVYKSVTNDSYFGSTNEHRNGGFNPESGKISDSKSTLQQTGERGLNFVVNVFQNIKSTAMGNNNRPYYTNSSSISSNSGYNSGYNSGAGYNSFNGNYSPPPNQSPQNDRNKTTYNDSNTYGTNQTNLRPNNYSNYQ